jgi:uncharacterized membrane protein YgcG
MHAGAGGGGEGNDKCWPTAELVMPSSVIGVAESTCGRGPTSELSIGVKPSFHAGECVCNAKSWLTASAKSGSLTTEWPSSPLPCPLRAPCTLHSANVWLPGNVIPPSAFQYTLKSNVDPFSVARWFMMGSVRCGGGGGGGGGGGAGGGGGGGGSGGGGA